MMTLAMKARVYVSLKPTVLDAQGQTIRAALGTLGHASVRDVRQGKFFEIQIADATDEAAVRAEVEKIAQDVLANPVIENYRVEIIS